jgi:hypothetical protein
VLANLKPKVTRISTELLADDLNHYVQVIHPTFSTGLPHTFNVTIEEIRDREEDSGDTVFRDLTFRGECDNDGWTGKKTFYASWCRRVVDRRTGEVMESPEAVTAWLRGIVKTQQEARREAEHKQAISGNGPGFMAQGLEHTVIVRQNVHRKTQEFRLTIDSLYRYENGNIRLDGTASQDCTPKKSAWTGKKSFYTNSLVDLADPQTGSVEDIEAYLVRLAQLGPP